MPDHAGPLPILQRRREIEEAIVAHQVVVVCGETGSGKSTQLPQICLELSDAASAKGAGAGVIAHTQPRRLAARAVAARIAEERGDALGGLVGFKVRFQDQTGPRTRIKVLTDGMLLAEMAGDPWLGEYSTIIIDEAHERSINIDFLLGCLRQILPRRPELRLIVTSATIDPRRFSDFFGGPAAAPIIEVSGRTYPVEIRYRPTDAGEEDFDKVEFEAVADAVDELCGPGREGDVLVFLPGERDIRLAGEAIGRRGVDVDVLPLYSRLSNQEQDRVFHPSPGRQRVILATNVAETSLTVPGIRFVVDTGLARMSRYDPARKIQQLPIEPISRASANQRSGRCGRVSAGVCIRLYSEESCRARPLFTEPEIRRTNLASVILQMRTIGGAGLGAVEDFAFLDAPDAAAIRDGYETLFELGAIDAPSRCGELTDVGRRMAQIPLDPRVARMLLAARGEGVLGEIVTLASVLEIQDPRERPSGRQDDADRAQLVFRHDTSDFLTLLKVWDQYSHAGRSMGAGALAGWCRQHFLSAARMREWGEMIRQIADVARELGLAGDAGRSSPAGSRPLEDRVHRALLTGLITSVACREGDGGFDYRGVRGNVVQIFPGSSLFKKGPRWIMAAEVVQTSRLYARTCARIDPAWVEELAGHMFKRQLSDRHLDPRTGQPSAWERVTMSGIVVVPRRRTAIASIEPRGAREVFIREALALMKWETDLAFMAHNRAMLERARGLEGKLRRRDVVAGAEQIAGWFEARVPKEIGEPEAFKAWLAPAQGRDPGVLRLAEADVLRPEASAAADRVRFPDAIELRPGAGPFPLDYAFAPGKDEDGITITVPLESLGDLTPERAGWLVPGMLDELVLGMLKTLPRGARASVEQKAPLATVAGACAGVIAFGVGSLGRALGEALEVLYAIRIDESDWSPGALPTHLRLRVRVVDHAGKEVAEERDLAALRARLDGRVRRALAARERSRFERRGLRTWDFDALSERVESERDGQVFTGYPMLVDEGASAWLTLGASSREAQARTRLGLRRLFVLECAEELGHYVDALPQWSEMRRHFGALGSAEELRDGVCCVIAERAFMERQAPVRTREEFSARLEGGRGRLGAIATEVGEMVGGILEPRFRVAQRISGGTPRLWAQSVGDIREHAVYLMPRGFLALAPPERLRSYPKYARVMRERLMSLREDGSSVEGESLRVFLPHWKRFTGWVAGAMASERESLEGEGQASRSAGRGGKAPLPAARRAGATINLDAGEWAMTPGNLSPAVDRYRWALEELRVVVFAPALAGGACPGEPEVEKLWASVAVESEAEGGGGDTRPRGRR